MNKIVVCMISLLFGVPFLSAMKKKEKIIRGISQEDNARLNDLASIIASLKDKQDFLNIAAQNQQQDEKKKDY